jgi:hypothetical protein
MAASQRDLKQRFESALKAYLKAINTKKLALIAAMQNPGKDDGYDKASADEKNARQRYRKATKKLRESFPKK